MCFSAPASFIAGTALSAAGVITLKKTENKREIPFASIPFLFGIQQIIEGFVWLSFSFSTPIWNSIFSHVFLFFAYVLWPIFIPFSIGLLETDASRKKLLGVFQVAGIAVASYLLFFMVSHPLISHAVNKSIVYFLSIPYGPPLVSLYVLVTCGSPLFSSRKIINIFGILVSVSFAIAYYFYTVAFASVWCFFSAILSGVIYLYFQGRKIDNKG
jgi:uncharacterized membrane protein